MLSGREIAIRIDQTLTQEATGTLSRSCSTATLVGMRHHGSPAEPQHEILGDTTDHIAMHKGSALRKRST